MTSIKYVHIKGVDIPVHIFHEHRRSVRASFTSKGINLRIPRADHDFIKHFEWCKKWATKTIENNPSIAYKYAKKHYRQNTIIPIYDQDYILQFKLNKSSNRLQAEINDDILLITTPQDPLPEDVTRKLIIKLFNQFYYLKIKERVDFINELTLKKPYQKLVLKLLKTQWGNCGGNKTIKLSTRILFLPEKIQNAIILHELVHLVHMDHSHRFYDLLYKHMPDYDKRDRWLKENEGWMVF